MTRMVEFGLGLIKKWYLVLVRFGIWELVRNGKGFGTKW